MPQRLINIPSIRQLPIGSPEGLILSHVTNGLIGISPGRAIIPGSNNRNIGILSNLFQKNLNNWTIGNGGGKFSGTPATAGNQTWHLFMIRRESDGLIDFGFDTSPIAANRPSGWDSRIIGSVMLESNGIGFRNFIQIGDRFEWATQPTDLSVTDLSTSSANQVTLTIPDGIPVKALIAMRVISPATAGFITIASPLSPSNVGRAVQFPSTSGFTQRIPWEIPTQNRLINVWASVAGCNTLLVTTGFLHPRGA